MGTYNEVTVECYHCCNASRVQTKCITSHNDPGRFDERMLMLNSRVHILDRRTNGYIAERQITLKLKGECPYCYGRLALFIVDGTIVDDKAEPAQYTHEELSLGYIRERDEVMGDPMKEAVAVASHFKPHEIWSKLGRCPNCIHALPECIGGVFVCPGCGWRNV